MRFRFQEFMANTSHGLVAVVTIKLLAAFVPFQDSTIELPGEDGLVGQLDQAGLPAHSLFLFAQLRLHRSTRPFCFAQSAGAAPDRGRKNNDDGQNENSGSKAEVVITQSLSEYVQPAQQKRTSHNYQ